MKLTPSQINEYREKGYLILEKLFTHKEVKRINEGIVEISSKPMPNIIREENGEIRSAFTTHGFEDEFSWLHHEDRLIKPIKELLNNFSIYLCTYKFNNTKRSNEEVMDRHEVDAVHAFNNGTEESLVLSVMILLEETEDANIPLMFAPNSSVAEIIESSPNSPPSVGNLNIENPLHGDIKLASKRDLSSEEGANSTRDTIGTAIFFNPNVFGAANRKMHSINIATATFTYCRDFKLF